MTYWYMILRDESGQHKIMIEARDREHALGYAVRYAMRVESSLIELRPIKQ
jgi:hypothetical protein